MFSLVLSVLALFIGVSVYPLIRRKPSFLSFFDAFGLISIVGLTMLHLIPHSVENGGILGLVAVGIGLGVPAALHLLQHHEHAGEAAHEEGEAHGRHSSGRTGRILMTCVLVGFAIHTLLDGIGLSMSSLDHAEMGQMLGLGVLFHRLPVGIFLSLILIPRIGLKKTWGLLAVLATTTILGYALGHFALPAAGLVFLYVLQGLIAGMLLHVVFHNISADGEHASGIARGLGALSGFGALVIVEWVAPVHAEEISILDIWLRYLLDAAPAWCAFAVLLAVAWRLSEKPGMLGAAAREVTGFLDPQPLPMLYGGSMHAFSASLVVLAWALFSPWASSACLVSVFLACLLARVMMKRVSCCASCSPGHYCARERSFGHWSVASCTQVAVWLLVASVLPALCEPIVEALEPLGPVARSCAAVSAVLAVLAFMLSARPPERLPNYVLAVFVISHILGAGPFISGCSAACASLLVVLYEYSFREIRMSEAGHAHWGGRFACTLVIAAVLPALALAGAAHFIGAQDGQGQRLTRYEIQAGHHGHDHGHESDGHGHAEAAHAHESDGHGHAEAAHAQEADGHVHGASILSEPLHAWHKAIPFAVFVLVFCFWMFRKGPRYMLEVSRGRHHHRHE